eukprot:TRINITY_DN14318_c0_g1_i1.p1 TRINITY_DN14318_c0_g1~~TRINITY_DN14318_c0_g1_i1.p1  ORF type:complete len:740 (-),score=104.15 TRINITY_DN14318_c0_g1_i1:228-2369(-)
MRWSGRKGGYDGKPGGGRGDGGCKGSGGKGKQSKGAMPWSFVPLCADGDALGLWELSQKVPSSWIDERHGGRPPRHRLHLTFMLKMSKVEHLDQLEKICGEAGPAELRVNELFLSHVERIRDAEVYCIGVSFESPALRSLKDAWLECEPNEATRRVHDPYPQSDGHVSLAYVHAESWDEANKFVEANKPRLQGRSYLVDAIIYEDERREQMKLFLTGTGVHIRGSQRSGQHDSAAASTSAHGKIFDVDGSVLEGGGQILRNSLGYAAILGYPVRIQNIRAKRKTPGLAAQHLESFKLVRDVCDAHFVGDKVGSCTVTFTPKQLKPGSYAADPKTAGAITLMVQASLMPLAYTGGCSEIELKGGTDVDFSPPLDFLQRVVSPTLAKMDVKVTASCENRGFFPAGGGLVRVWVEGLQGPPKPITLDSRGSVTRIEAICYATPSSGWLDDEDVQRTVEDFEPWLAEELADKGQSKPRVSVQCVAEHPPVGRPVNKASCEIVVHTSGGGLFHGSAGAFDGPRSAGSLYNIWGAAAEKALGPLKKQLRSGAALDEHLLDQLILTASLAKGTTRLLGDKELTLHAQTAIFVAEKMVPGVRFNVTKQMPSGLTLVECHGIGLAPGGPPVDPFASASAATGEVVAQLARGTLSQATAQMLADFRNDLQQFGAHFGVAPATQAERDQVSISGCHGAEQVASCKAELQQIFNFYQLVAPQWNA